MACLLLADLLHKLPSNCSTIDFYLSLIVCIIIADSGSAVHSISGYSFDHVRLQNISVHYKNDATMYVSIYLPMECFHRVLMMSIVTLLQRSVQMVHFSSRVFPIRSSAYTPSSRV